MNNHKPDADPKMTDEEALGCLYKLTPLIAVCGYALWFLPWVGNTLAIMTWAVAGVFAFLGWTTRRDIRRKGKKA